VLKEAGCGLVVNPLNADNLARTIVSFANLPLLERRLCGERAFSYARRHFLFGVMVRNLRGFYSRILK
jgi:glycosyltransferase involved in cell wall biosynthesis